MVSRRSLRGLLVNIALLACGIVGTAAWTQGKWSTCFGSIAVALWLMAAAWAPGRASRQAVAGERTEAEDEAVLLRVLLDQVPTPLILVEASRAHALNRAGRALFNTDGLIFAPPADLVAPDARRLFYEGRNWRIDRVTAAAEEHHRALLCLIDIDAEASSAEAKAIADMVQVAGHELLNGLAPIISLAESAQAAAEGAKGNPLLSEILGTLGRRAEGLQRFCDAYRALGRLPEPRREVVPLIALTDDLAKSFRGCWQGSISLETDVPNDLAACLDRDQITQAIWALLQNAAEAAGCATSQARVSLSAHAAPNGIVVEVRDNGPGVPNEHVDRIFRPFYTTKDGGTGIGLSLARQIVLAHGGHLRLEPGPETIFRMSLPAQEPS